MEFEPNYGSSEYSTKAEELFAEFLLDAEQGKAQDFEEFCAENDSCADELYGLHADWDNVRGLLAQLKGRRVEVVPTAPAPVAQPDPVEIAKREAAVEPFSAKDVPDPKEEDARQPQRALKLIAGVGGALAVFSMVWAAQLSRNGQVLAREKQDLVQAQEASLGQLATERNSGRALAEHNQELASNLADTLEAKQSLEVDRDSLNVQLEEGLARRQVLTSANDQLGLELEQERVHSQRVAEQAETSKTQAEVLELQVNAARLIARETDLWPATAATIESLGQWLQTADALASQWDRLKTTGSYTQKAPHSILALVESSGLIERVRGRQRVMELWREEIAPTTEGPWADAVAYIGDVKSSPLYAGLDLQPQFSMVPLGRSPRSGLWRFADRSSGPLPGLDEQDQLSQQPNGCVVFLLIPGLELEGHQVHPFFVSEEEWSPEQRESLHAPATSAGFASGQPGESALHSRVQYELDLLRLGYEPITSIQAVLARQHGVAAATWKSYPVRQVTR
ncbi:MAG: hypothetical protein ACI9F9_002780 [Candidatus Paceibacteria bacterium]|jgi:hypothetical protein